VDVPDELFYSEDHQWVRIEGELLRVGITAYAQDALGEVTMVQLVEPGEVVATGDELGEVEAFKAMTDLYMPIAGTMVEHNTTLATEPTSINTDPYGAGWVCVVRPTDGVDHAQTALLDASAYRSLIDVAA